MQEQLDVSKQKHNIKDETLEEVPELRFPEFFDNWNYSDLEKVSTVKDGTHDSPKYHSEGYPLVTSKNLLKNGNLDLNNVNLISKEDFDKINKRSKVDNGDILFGMIGTIGNPTIVNTSNFAIKNVALIKEEDKLKNDFLIHVLNSTIIEKRFYKLNAGGTQKFIALKLIRNLQVPVPSLEEQNKISKFLGLIDKKIELLEKEYLNYLNFFNNCSINLFQQKYRFRDSNNMFHDWNEFKLKEISEVITGTTPSTKDKFNLDDCSYLWVTPGDMGDFKFITKTERYLSEKGLINGREVPANSILVTCIGATIGKVGMILEKGSCNQQVNAIVPNECYYPPFIYYLMQRNAQRLKLYAGNTATPILNKKSFENISFEFPSYEEQKKIADFLSKIDLKLEFISKKIKCMEEYKRGLLQKMFV